MLAQIKQIDNIKWFCDACEPFVMNDTYKNALVKLVECADAFNGLVKPFRDQLAIIDSDKHEPTAISSEKNDQPQTLSQLVIQQKQQQQQNQDKSSDTDGDSSSGLDKSFCTAENEPMETQINTVDISGGNPLVNITQRKRKLPPPKNDEAKRIKNDVVDLSTQTSGASTDKIVSNLHELVSAPPPTESKPAPLGSTSKSRLIYISNLQPKTEIADIIQHLKSLNLDKSLIDRIVVAKLVPPNKESNRFSFVSFKLQVPIEYYDVIAHPNVWPKGVSVREFVSRNREPIAAANNLNSNFKTNRSDQRKNTRGRFKAVSHRQNKGYQRIPNQNRESHRSNRSIQTNFKPSPHQLNPTNQQFQNQLLQLLMSLGNQFQM